MSQSPEAYERLILDAMRGDATLFTRNDEVDAQWSIIDPILKAWHAQRRARRCRPTRPARAGPAEADALLGAPVAELAQRCERGRLERARHDAGADRGGAARTCSAERYQRGPRVRPRARDQPGRDRRRASSAARSRTGSQRVGRYHPSRLVLVRGRGRAARRSTRGRRVGTRGRRAPARATSRSARERVEIDVGPQHLDAPRHDRRPAARLRPRDDGVGAARPRRGGRRAAPARQIVLVDTQDEPEPRDALRARARPGRASPTWSTSRGCARRRGASASPPPSTRRSCAARSASIAAVTVRHRARLGGRRRCCSAAGWPRGSAGARSRSARRAATRCTGHARARRGEVRDRARAGRAWARRAWPG